MSRFDHLLGLTPVFKRLAFHYLQRGLGSHAIDHPQYDKVVVRPLYDWQTSTDENLPSQGGVVVEFHRANKRVRWVEFGCRVVGGGGEPIVREV
jgi:hypothetical protein